MPAKKVIKLWPRVLCTGAKGSNKGSDAKGSDKGSNKGADKGTNKGPNKGTDKGPDLGSHVTPSPTTPSDETSDQGPDVRLLAVTDTGHPAYVFFGIRRKENDYVNIVATVRADGTESEPREYTDTLAVRVFGPLCLEHFVSLLRLKYMGIDYVRAQRDNNAGAGDSD